MYQYIWFNIYTIVMKEAECVTMGMPVPREYDWYKIWVEKAVVSVLKRLVDFLINQNYTRIFW